MEKLFDVRMRSTDAGHFVAFLGELDAESRQHAVETLVAIAGSTVLLDLSGLRFMDACGIGALVEAKRTIESRGNQLEIRGASKIVRTICAVNGLSELLAD